MEKALHFCLLLLSSTDIPAARGNVFSAHNRARAFMQLEYLSFGAVRTINPVPLKQHTRGRTTPALRLPIRSASTTASQKHKKKKALAAACRCNAPLKLTCRASSTDDPYGSNEVVEHKMST